MRRESAAAVVALQQRGDVVLLPKPLAADFAEMREGQTLWGWPHLVQDPDVTQLAIDHKLSVIAWESMNHRNRDGSFSVHVFHLNNEIAGYAAVIHALQLRGMTGHCGRKLRATVISFGATARGAVRALESMGIHDVEVITQRDTPAVAAPSSTIVMGRFERPMTMTRAASWCSGLRVPRTARSSSPSTT